MPRSNNNNNNSASSSNSRSPKFGRRLRDGKIYRSNDSISFASINTSKNTLKNNNNNNSNIGAAGIMNNISSGSAEKSETTWIMNIIPLFLICAFALAFRIMANRYTFCNITNNVCSSPSNILIEPKNSTEENFNDANNVNSETINNVNNTTTNNNNGSNNNNNSGNNNVVSEEQDGLQHIFVTCPENKSAEPTPPETDPTFITVVLWLLFALSLILLIWTFYIDGSNYAKVLIAALAVTFFGLATDASVNQNVGRSVTAVMVMLIMVAIIIAIVNVVSGGSHHISIASAIAAFTLIGILADNKRLIQDGHVGYAITRSITMLLFVLNIVYSVILFTTLTIAIINLGLRETLTTEYTAILLLLCMLAQITVYGIFLNKCLKKKYECLPSVHIVHDGLTQPEDQNKNSATRIGEFVAKCSVNGVETLNVSAATISISILAVVVFLFSIPRVIKGISGMSGFGNVASSGITILVCIVLLVLSFIN